MRALDAAALVHEQMTPWQDHFVWSGALGYGHVRLWLGVAAATLGRDDEADEHFAFACRSTTTTASVVVGPIAARLGGGARGERRARASAGARGARARARPRVRLRPDRSPGRADRRASTQLRAADPTGENRRTMTWILKWIEKELLEKALHVEPGEVVDGPRTRRRFVKQLPLQEWGFDELPGDPVLGRRVRGSRFPARPRDADQA